MMRLTMALFWGLVICWLLAGPAEAEAQSVPSTVAWPREVEGNALDSHEKARLIAIDNAREKIVDFLRKQKPPMRSFQPSAADVEKMIAGERPGADFQEGTFTFKRWILTLKAPDLEELRRLDRQAYLRLELAERESRRGKRLLLTAKAVAAILVLLAAVVGYIRLDELTRRSYTLWLRLGLATLVVSTAVGLWLMR